MSKHSFFRTVPERTNKLKRRAVVEWILAWGAASSAFVWGADLSRKPGGASEEVALPTSIEPVLRQVDGAGREQLMLGGANAAGTPLGKEIAFRAVRSSGWPSGLVPLFGVSHDTSFELSRLPAPGLENSSEPLFFALPDEGEFAASKLCGRWEFRAVRNGSTSMTALEMTVFEGRVSARFDQNTDYGFASFSRGTFETNRLHLKVAYIGDGYELEALWADGVLRGSWRSLGGSEGGTWEAVRRSGDSVLEDAAVPLFEWTRNSDGAKRYEAGDGGRRFQGWKRSERPLCRVWR